MKTGPLAYLWLATAGITSKKINNEDEVFDLMKTIISSLDKTSEHLWYSKIGDLCKAFTKWCISNSK